MVAKTLVIRWGKDTNTEISETTRTIDLGLGSRKKLTSKEIAVCKQTRPEKIILSSQQDGGIGPNKMLVYVSEWVVSFEKKIYFKDAKFNAGRRTEDMPRQNVPVSHGIMLGQLGRELFELPRFHGILLWGDRHIDSGEKIHVVEFGSEDRKKFKMVFDDMKYVHTMVAFSKVLDDEPELSIISSEELEPRKAIKKGKFGVSGPTALIDLARQNSQTQIDRIKFFEEEEGRGQEARRILEEIEKHIPLDNN